MEYQELIHLSKGEVKEQYENIVKKDNIEKENLIKDIYNNIEKKKNDYCNIILKKLDDVKFLKTIINTIRQNINKKNKITIIPITKIDYHDNNFILNKNRKSTCFKTYYEYKPYHRLDIQTVLKCKYLTTVSNFRINKDNELYEYIYIIQPKYLYHYCTKTKDMEMSIEPYKEEWIGKNYYCSYTICLGILIFMDKNIQEKIKTKCLECGIEIDVEIGYRYNTSELGLVFTI